MSSQLGDLKVLIVEDQDDMREMIKKMLAEDMNVTQVFEAGNGEEALGLMQQKSDFIDVIICDWNMPQMSGLDLLKDIRKMNPGMPFLMVTGRSDMESVVEAKEIGVTAYVRKPFTSKQLEAKLRIILYKIAA